MRMGLILLCLFFSACGGTVEFNQGGSGGEATTTGGAGGSAPPTIYVGQTGDGGGGAGGTGSGGGDVVSTCSPVAAFNGSTGCFVPDALCCPDPPALDEHCYAATEGLRPVASLCPSVPDPLGGTLTDNRDCSVIETSQIDCTWGVSTILCCEVSQ